MREAPIVRREHAIAVRYYADPSSRAPGFTACLTSECTGCIFVAACSAAVPPVLSCPPVTAVGPRTILCHVLGWTAGYPRWAATTTSNMLLVQHIQPVLPPKQSWPASRPQRPRSRSNDRQPREIVRYAPTRLISPRSVNLSTSRCTTKSTCLLPPASCGVGSYRADATETARDRRACNPYEDECGCLPWTSTTYRLLSPKEEVSVAA